MDIELLELISELAMSEDKSRKALGAEIKRLTQKQTDELTALRTAARVLVDKMNHIYNTPKYRAVWELWQLHNGQYAGENWIKEFDALAARLDGKE